MDQDEEPGLRSIGSHVSDLVNSLAHSYSTSTKPPTSSATTGYLSPAPKRSSSIGTALSTTDCERSLTEALACGETVAINRAVEDSLSPFASLCWRAIATDDPYTTYAETRLEIDWRRARDDRALMRRIFEPTMLPAPRSETIKALGRLRALTISRAADVAEGAMILAAFADEMANYPADAVMTALAAWPRKHKFWPALAEILEEVKDLCRLRLAIAVHLGLS